MFETSRETLVQFAGLLCVMVAGIHLYWGIPRFLLYTSIGTMPDPRPLAFVLSGHAILIAVTLTAAGVLEARRLYLPGIGLMILHIVGYAAWHTVLSHGVSGTAHTHATSTLLGQLQIVIEHLLHSPLPLISKVAELAVLVLLLGLARNRSAR
jgi:hypothetical protein